MCSSAVTTHLVLRTEFKIASLSKGLIVWILMTSAEMPSSFNTLAASNASQTKCPVAIIVTSFPSVSWTALPISNFWSSAVKLGTFGLPKRRYTGPWWLAIANVAALVWLKSQLIKIY